MRRLTFGVDCPHTNMDQATEQHLDLGEAVLTQWRGTSFYMISGEAYANLLDAAGCDTTQVVETTVGDGLPDGEDGD
jgi:hypothetical protein